MQTTPKKSDAEPAPPLPANAKLPGIASASIPDTLAGFHVNPETGRTRAEVDACPAAILVVTGAGCALAVPAVIGRVLGLVAVG